jgi:hypothetical protein
VPTSAQNGTAQAPAQAETPAQTGPNPGSRAQLIQTLNENTWQFFALLNYRIPGILLERADREQLLFAPFHSCQPVPFTPQELESASVATLDALLVSSQKAVGQYLQAHEAQIGNNIYEDENAAAKPFAPKAVHVRGHFCVPQAGFSALPAADGQTMTMKRELKREERQFKSGGLMGNPLFVDIARQPEEAPLSNMEVRNLVSWIGWLREFRNSAALYEAFHAGKGQILPPPAFTVSHAVAKKVGWLQSGLPERTAEGVVRRENGEGPLTPEMLTARKIYDATAEIAKLPHFEACGELSCLVDGVRENVEALDEKIVLALQDRKPKPGAYIDALIMLAKRSSVVELAAINQLLPKALQQTKLPAACLLPTKEVSFLGDGVNDYEKILASFSERDERAWWVQQVTVGVQELVTAYQLRRKRVNVPAVPARVFSVGGERGTLYDFGQSMVHKWFNEFFEQYQSQVANGYAPLWLPIRDRLIERSKQTPFSESLRLQHGQESLRDFTSSLGEKLLLLFATTSQDLVENIDKTNIDKRKAILVELVRKVVESALKDSLYDYTFGLINPYEFFAVSNPEEARAPEVLEGSKKEEASAPSAQNAVVLLTNPFSRMQRHWNQQMQTAWVAFLENEGAPDTTAMAKAIVNDLFEMPSVQKTLKEGHSYQSDKVARETVQEHVGRANPMMEEAARAQETVEYMRTMAAWQLNPLARFGPYGSYDAAMAGMFPGTESACFYADDKNGHGKGINTFGALDPNKQEDYDHLKKAIALIALRNQKKIEERISRQFPDAVLQRAVKVADSHVLSNLMLEKFNEVLQAKDTLDKGRVSAIRREQFSEFQTWLNNWEPAQQWYKTETERLSKQLFESELKPLLQIRPTQAEAQPAWEAYFQSRLQGLFESRFPLSRTPVAKDFLALYEAKGANKSEASVDISTRVGALVKGIQTSLTANPKFCETNPKDCLAWIDSIEALLKEEGLVLLQSARAAHYSSLKTAGYTKNGDAASFNLVDLSRKEITRLGWLTEELIGENWASEKKPRTVKRWASALSERIKTDQSPALVAAVAKSDELFKKREAHIAKAYELLDLFMKELAQSKARTSTEIRASMMAFFAAHPEVYAGWKAQNEDLLSTARALIGSADAGIVNEGTRLLRLVVSFELAKLSTPEVLAALDTTASAPFHAVIVEKYLPTYFDFRKEAQALILQATVPQTEVTESMVALEKSIEQAEDGLSLLKKQGKGESADAKKLVKSIAEALQDRQESLDRYRSALKLRRLLKVVGDKLPAAKKALDSLEQVQATDDLLATLYNDSKTLRPEGRLSPAETLADLNSVAQSLQDTLPASVATARAYLQDVSAFCKVAQDARLRPHFLNAYTKMVNIHIASPSPVSRERLARLAQVPATGAKAAWQGLWGRSAELRQQIASMDWSNISKLRDQAKAAAASTGKVDFNLFLKEALPTADEFCGYVEKRSQKLISQIASAKPEEPTSSQWRQSYWEFVELFSSVVSPYGVFAPFVQEVGPAEVVGLKKSPSDAAMELDTVTSLTAISTPTLVEFLQQAPSAELLGTVWPTPYLTALSLTTLMPSQVKEPLVWLNGTNLFQRTNLSQVLKDFLWKALVNGNAASPLLSTWKAPSDAPTSLEDLHSVAQLYELVAKAVRVSPKGNDGPWAVFTKGFVQSFIQNTQYRVDGDRLLLAEDVDGKLLARSIQELDFLLTEKNTAALQRLASAASDILLTATTGQIVLTPADAKANPAPATWAFSVYFARKFLTMPQSNELGVPALQWATKFALSASNGQNAYASAAPVFADQWAPTGTPGTQAEQFTKWMEVIGSVGAEKAFEKLRAAERKAGDREHLWTKFGSLAELRQAADSEYTRLVQFFEKWDRNSKAQAGQKTYPYFLALLNWHIHHTDSDLKITDKSNRQPLFDSFLSHRLGDLTAELGLPLDDFDGWRRLLVEKGTAVDWLAMADNKLSALVDTSSRRFYSTLIDAPEVENPYRALQTGVAMLSTPAVPYVTNGDRNLPVPTLTTQASYYYRAFPMVSPKERSNLRSGDSFPEWYAKTQDPNHYALYRVMQGDRPQIPLFNQSVADSLEMQGENSLVYPTQPVKHSAFKTSRMNWNAYFTNAAAKAASEQVKPEVIAAIREQVPGASGPQVAQILSERELLVAFRLAANELLIRYPHEDYKTDLFRTDGLALQSDLNALVAAYAQHLRWKGKIPAIDLSAWRLAEAHRQGVGKAIFLASNMAFGSLFLGKDDEQKKQVEAILTQADAYYRQQAQTNTYTRGLVKVSQNIQDNLEKLCVHRREMTDVNNEADFEKNEETIWKMKLPLMENLLVVAEELSPPGSSDEPRRMMQVLLRKSEQEKEKAKNRDAWIAYGMTAGFVAFVLASRSPALARMAATSPMLASFGGTVGTGISMGLGLYFGTHLYTEIREDFVTAPDDLARINTVRDSGYTGELPLMTDESAALRADGAKALLDQQRSTFTWVMRIVNVAMTIDMVGIPALKFLKRMPRLLVNSSRTTLASIRQYFSGGRQVAAATTENFFARRADVIASSLNRLGMAEKEMEALTAAEATAEKALTTIEREQAESLQKVLNAWEADGQLIPQDKSMVEVLLKDVRRQIETTARTADLDALTFDSLVDGSGPQLLEFQEKMVVRLKALTNLESKLKSAVPHASAAEMRMLLENQASVLATHRPLYLQLTGMPAYVFSPSARALYRVQKVVQAGADARKALGYHYLGNWIVEAGPSLRLLAKEHPDRTEVSILQGIVEETLFAPGVGRELFGPNADKLNGMAEELRQVLRLAGLKPNAAFYESMAAEDFTALSRYYVKGIKPAVAAALNADETANPVSEVAPAAAEVAEPQLEVVTSSAIEVKAALLGKLETKAAEPIANYAAYESQLQALLKESVPGASVDSKDILRLVEGHSSRTLYYQLGEAQRLGGAQMDGVVAELKLAAALRENLEWSLSVTPGGKLPSLSGELTSSKIMAREMVPSEARGVLGLPARGEIKLAVVRFKGESFPSGADRQATEAAVATLTKFDPATRQLYLVEDLMRAAEMPVERFADPQLLARLAAPKMAGRLRADEQLQLARLVQPPQKLTSTVTARNVLGLEAPAANADVAETTALIQARAAELTQSIRRVGGESKAVKNALENVRLYEKLLIDGLGK